MTLSEYRKKVLKDLSLCETEDEGVNVVERTQRTLDNSGIGSEAQKEFWIDLHIEAEGLSFIGEAQGADSLSAILSKVREVVRDKAKE